MPDIHTPASALIKALEASIALYQDEVTGKPDWSIGVAKFWMKLNELGFEITEQSDGPEGDDWRCPRCGLDRQAHAYACTHIDGEDHG